LSDRKTRHNQVAYDLSFPHRLMVPSPLPSFLDESFLASSFSRFSRSLRSSFSRFAASFNSFFVGVRSVVGDDGATGKGTGTGAVTAIAGRVGGTTIGATGAVAGTGEVGGEVLSGFSSTVANEGIRVDVLETGGEEGTLVKLVSE